MKRSFFPVALFCMLTMATHAQLANTKWNGTVNLLMQDNSLKPASITWDFGKDTVKVIFKDGGEPEVLTYTVQKNMLTMVKVSGGSPCNTGATGKLKFQVKGNELFMEQAESDCDAFSKALDKNPFTRVK